MEIKFTQNALKEIDMDQEEFDDFYLELQKKLEDGTFFADSEPVDMDKLEKEEPEVYKSLIEALDSIDDENLN